MLFSIIVLSVTLSIDALGIGIAYGIRKIRLTFPSALIISIIALIFSFLSILAGKLLICFLPSSLAKLIGVSILIFMGIWIIVQGIQDKKAPCENKKMPFPSKEHTSKFISLIINILKAPEYSDLNNSGSIEAKEALYLGTALSVDMIGAGIGISVLGINSFFIPVCIAVSQLLFLSLGLFLGKLFLKNELKDSTAMLLSGIIIIFIALCHLIL